MFIVLSRRLAPVFRLCLIVIIGAALAAGQDRQPERSAAKSLPNISVRSGSIQVKDRKLAEASFVGTTYYVDNTNPSCSNSGSGTSQSTPFCTIGKAATVVAAGGTVQVLAGTYAETVNPTNTGASGSPLTFSASPGVVLTGGSGSGNGFSIFSKTYVVIDGFTIRDTVGYGISVTTSDHITISNNHVTSAGSPALGLTKIGILLSGTTASLVTGNTTDHNSQDGIRLSSGSANNIVSNNVSYGNAEEYERNATGIHVNGVGSNTNTIIRNVTFGNEDSGLQFYAGAQNNLVIDNLSYGNGDHGIDCNFGSGNTIVGNTIHGNVTAGINLEGAAGQGSGNATLANNIVSDNGLRTQIGGGTASGQAGNIRIDAQSVAGTSIDYDLVYLTSAGTTIQWNGTNYPSLAAFKTANPTQEVHGLESDPIFTSPAPIAQRPAAAPFNVAVNQGNYHLLTGSPAIDSANSNAPNETDHDIEGTMRIDDPATADTGAGIRTYDDRGAYEYSPLGTTAAEISISGRVRTANGRGIQNISVTVWGGDLTEPVKTRTIKGGYFSVGGLAAGNVYFVLVKGQRFAFEQPVRVITAADDIANLEFIAEDR